MRDHGEATSRWRRRLGDLVGASIAVLWTLAAMWLLQLGSRTQLGWILTSFAGLALLWAWPLGVAAAWLRRPAIVVAAIALVPVQLVVLGPRLHGADVAPRTPATITVGSANVYVDNVELDRFAQQLAADPPDVMALEEFPEGAPAAMRRAGLERSYPHRILRPGGTGGLAIYSRFPIREVRSPRPSPDHLAVAIALPGGRTLRLVAVHVFPPPASDGGQWAADLDALDRFLHDLPRPWVAIGDYNATFDHRAFRGLLHDGRQDAHLVTGRGWARSWPVKPVVPPVLLIDHAVVSPGVRVSATGERTLAGSDHRMIEVDLR